MQELLKFKNLIFCLVLGYFKVIYSISTLKLAHFIFSDWWNYDIVSVLFKVVKEFIFNSDDGPN